uniref:Uncharacterized protein n=1 Tax=Sphaerodactylus townsendi TaxID=933632 RepID=A0ACB8FG21_9SAUR
MLVRWKKNQSSIHPLEAFLEVLMCQISLTNTSGTISLTAYNTHRVYSYHAGTVDNTRRDFRMKRAAGNSSQDNPVKWIQTDIKEVKRNVYVKEMTFPGKGWRGFFIEVVRPENALGPFMETTEMLIMPDTYPCDFCHADGCRGTIV